MTKISQLSDIGASLAGGDEFVIRDVSDATTPNKKVTSSGIIDYVIGTGSVTGFTKISAGAGPLSEVACTFSGSTGTITMGTASAGSPVERLRIDSSGRVGIGTSSPARTLDVTPSVVNTVAARFGNAAGRGLEISTFQTQTVNDAGVAFNALGVGAGAFAFQTDSTERLRIDSSGNVGIGTSSPGELLDVRGGSLVVGSHYVSTVNTNYRIRLESVGAANNNNYTGEIGLAGGGVEPGDSSMTFATRKWNGSAYVITEKVRIDSSGRLLVGTSSATTGSLLAVAGGDIIIRKDSGGDEVGVDTYKYRLATQSGVLAEVFATSEGAGGASGRGGALKFFTKGDNQGSTTERMRITSGGSVYIANAAGGSGSYAGYGGEVFAVRGALNTSLFWTEGIENDGVAIQGARGTNGFVCTWFNNGTKVGDISVTASATAYNTGSDYRLKENIISLTGAIDRLNQLQVHRFNFIADPETTVDGFIAHEAQAVVPECVTGQKDAVDDDGNPIYQGIDQSKLVPLLTAALQEAVAKIETLEAKVAALEAA